MKGKEYFLSKAVSEKSVSPDQNNRNYTIPRTYGVYEVEVNNGKRFRFGNHPVRENELFREFSSVKRIALFLNRDDAKDFADLLND